MSRNPLPTTNPRKNRPVVHDPKGGHNWGGRIGSGCWIARDPDANHRHHEIDRLNSTLRD